MRVSRLLSFLMLCLLLAGCTIPGQAQPTTPPIIIIASPQVATTGRVPTSTNRAAPTRAATTQAQATAAPGEIRGTITVAFDAFPSYYPILIMDQLDLLEQRGYELKVVPFLLNDENDFSEQERFDNLRNGTWDVLATTLDGFARNADPAIGAITTVIDESAGADKLVAKPEIGTINDLVGQRVAYSEGSVGEYFLYYSLSLAGLGPGDVTLVPHPGVAEAVAAYTAGEADAVSAWEPDVLEAEQAGAKVLIASDKLRAILDVLVTSRASLDGKAEGMQAFHDSWYEALQLMTDRPDEAEQAIIEWGNPDWSFIAAPGDLGGSLGSLAQATLGANQFAFRSPDIIVSRLAEAQQIWRAAGQSPPEVDLTGLVDGRFVGAVPRSLSSAQPPTNNTFLLTAQVELPQLSPEEEQGATPIVKLPLEKIDFEPDSLRLTSKASEDLTDQVLPVLRSSRLYLKIDGSAAWPGPEGTYSEENIRSFALNRARSVATFLAQQGIDPNRLIVGTLDPKFPNSTDEAELTQDRIVRFTLVTPGGR